MIWATMIYPFIGIPLEISDTNSPTCQTPFIDDLAKNGMYFTDFYCGAAVCSPSRAALLTGRNKTRLGIYNWIPPEVPMHLESEETIIAEMLHKKNYATGHFGKWHLTSANMTQPEPLDQGFDYAFWTHNNAIPSHKNPTNFIRNKEAIGKMEGYSSHLLVEEAIQWMESRKDAENPFFINIWFHEPHHKEAAPDSLKIKHKKNQEYYGCIENMDYAVGKLTSYLKENKLDENTIIIYTSDNGSDYWASNKPFRGEKHFQYEGGIRVPFIVFWKAKIPAGTKSNVIGHFTDILPTIASITGSQIPQNKIIDGEDLSKVFLGKTKNYERTEPVFFYRYFHDPICMLRQNNMVLLGYQDEPKPWMDDYDGYEESLIKPNKNEPKYSQWSFQKSHMEFIKLQEPKYFELYNMEEDLEQRSDISKDNPELTESMKKMMLNKRKEMLKEGGDWY
jgi:arylsulfatase A